MNGTPDEPVEAHFPTSAGAQSNNDAVVNMENCRSCGSPEIEQILDLGRQPVANALLTDQMLSLPDELFPLSVQLCRKCALLQVGTTISPALLFKSDYPYFSSQNPTLLEHAREHVEQLIADRHLDAGSFVVEVASNDGYLLCNLVNRGIPVLGVDPADGPAARANEIGVPTLCEFFSRATGARLAAEGKQADVVIANNVIAHVDQINDFMGGVEAILKPQGIAVFEFAYAVDMITHCEFDTIYHEHLFYHTLHGLAPLLERHGLHIVDAERLEIHGGSLRVRVTKQPGQSARLEWLWANERELGVGHSGFYRDFAQRTQKLREELRDLLCGLKEQGKRIACYGAAAKGSTMVNYLNLGHGFFDFVVDQSIHKQGKYMPGQRIPIRPTEELRNQRPDYVLILAWNFADDIIRTNADYHASGGRFIVPVPQPRII
jgi:SAM-dependent methyltransferase